ncbi:MAG TPA: hypothetical protein VL463_24010 [Kofleriaceae bacterium]|nr:hypothetical protein [Kofleriaceae bacterium]
MIMALGELLHALERDGDAAARAVRDAAAAEIARLDAGAARARAARLAEDRDAFGAAAQARADARVADAVRVSRATTFAARADLLGRVRDALRGALPSVLRERADTLGPALVTAAIDAAGGAAGVMQVAPAIEACARAAAPPTLRIELAEVTGAVIELERGVRIDATLDAILDRSWPRLAPRALAEVPR